jgi:hypothetical protein
MFSSLIPHICEFLFYILFIFSFIYFYLIYFHIYSKLSVRDLKNFVDPAYLCRGTTCHACEALIPMRLGKQAYVCRDCGITTHKPCHVKVNKFLIFLCEILCIRNFCCLTSV